MRKEYILRFLSISMFFFFVTSFNASASIPEGFIKIDKSQERGSSLGFYFMSPVGNDWYEGYSSHSLMYFKLTDVSKLSFFAGASEVPYKGKTKTEEAVLNYVKKYKNDWGNDKDRYKNTKLQTSIEQSSNLICVKYSQQAEDHKARNLGSNKFLLMTNVGRVCLEPKSENMLLDIHYSLRTIPDLKVDEYINQGESFIQSLSYKN